MANRVNNVTAETRAALLRKSARGLPMRPMDHGWTQEDIRKVFYAAFLDEKVSLLAELNRIVKELNDIFSKFDGSGENGIVLNDSKEGRAEGKNSTSAGTGTIASVDDQMVAGRYNAIVKSLFSIGCGTDDENRENAMWVDVVDGEARIYLKEGAYLTGKMLDTLYALMADVLDSVHTNEIIVEHEEPQKDRKSIQTDESIEAKGNISALGRILGNATYARVMMDDQNYMNVGDLPKRRMPLEDTATYFYEILPNKHYHFEGTEKLMVAFVSSGTLGSLDDKWELTFRINGDGDYYYVRDDLKNIEGRVEFIYDASDPRMIWMNGIPRFQYGKLYHMTFTMGENIGEIFDYYEGDLICRWEEVTNYSLIPKNQIECVGCVSVIARIESEGDCTSFFLGEDVCNCGDPKGNYMGESGIHNLIENSDVMLVEDENGTRYSGGTSGNLYEAVGNHIAVSEGSAGYYISADLANCVFGDIPENYDKKITFYGYKFPRMS